MINEAPLARFAPLAGGLVKPIYADYAFGNIADTIEYLLTGARRSSKTNAISTDSTAFSGIASRGSRA